jgi:hypothetical protein
MHFGPLFFWHAPGLGALHGREFKPASLVGGIWNLNPSAIKGLTQLRYKLL